MNIARNPILKGFYPDPSICRVEKDYYIATSSFAYAPGVPIFHSTDLIHWEQAGHVLERREQLYLEGAKMSQGIYAPCLRYHNGIFYLITTNVFHGGNFYVTAKHPQGPWSDPVYLENAPGIDPSLYFEEEHCYYIGQCQKTDARYYGDCEIWIQELDLQQGKLIGEIYKLWDGALKNANWAEGPRLYKKEDYYYLLIAEGGTEYGHSICAARSRVLFGPYEPCPYNPIFTHRHLGHSYPIQNAGHGDLVETPEGNWYITMLATRPSNGCAELGRETFLADVTWEEGWPVINAGEGKLREFQPVIPGEKEEEESGKRMVSDIVWTLPLDKRCIFFRYPRDNMYQVFSDGRIGLQMLPDTLSDSGSPAYIGTRLTSREFILSVKMEFIPEESEEAGLVYLYDENNYLKLTIHKRENQYQAGVVLVEKGKKKKLLEVTVEGSLHILAMSGSGQKLSVFMDERPVLKDIPVRTLSAEWAQGFVGCTVGIYATSNHKKSRNRAVFGTLMIKNIME